MEKSISIITSVRNCRSETEEYLNSLIKFAPKNLMEKFIVDDGSDSETQQFLASKSSDFTLLRNSQSRGFAFSNNLAASKAKSEWLLFLNNDLVLLKGWWDSYDSLISGGDNLSEIGCVGNVQVDPVTRKIDHAGVIFENGIPEHFCKGQKNPPEDFQSEYLAVTGACFLIRRDLFLEIGGFDETYKTGFEDIDLCLRLSMLGFTHFVLNQSVVLHKKSSTPERNQFQEHNSKFFYGRWGRVITRFQEWENARKISKSSNFSKKNGSLGNLDYVLKKKEAFLFSDRRILKEYFNIYLSRKKTSFARKILSILKARHGFDDFTPLCEARYLAEEKKFDEAKIILETFLKNEPEKVEALLCLSSVSQKAGNWSVALRALNRVKKNDPSNPRTYAEISQCKMAMGKIVDAEKNARMAILLDPEFSFGWEMLSKIYRKTKNYSKELNALKALLSQKSKRRKIIGRLLEVYFAIGKLDKVWSTFIRFQQSIKSEKHLLICAEAGYKLGAFNKCKSLVKQILDTSTDSFDGLLLGGNLAVNSREFAVAIDYYEKALEIRPESWEVLSNLINAKSFICDWSDRESHLNKLQFHSEEMLGKAGVFEIPGLQLNEEDESLNAHARSSLLLETTKHLREKLKFSFSNNEGVKKKIGFLSSDFRNHAVGHQMIGLLENLDPEKYEFFLFSTSPHEDSDLRKRFECVGEKFRDISGLSLIQRASIIHQSNLDLLIDLGGYSRGHNAEILALRPSPRQVHFLGFASTMGKGVVDYTIADRFTIPSSSSKFYGEQVVRMDGCFFPPGEFEGFAPRVKRQKVGLPSRGIVFCAFHAAYKLNPEIWSSWMRILKAVPESVLWLKFKPANDAINNLKKEAVRLGVSSKRIILAEDLSDRKDHLSRMAVADLYLDCPEYNGHASAMDALHAKLPILTIKGNRFCNRVGESFCKHLGLGEMVVRDLNQYEKKAIELGLRPSLLLPLRKKIQENVDSVLSPVAHAQRFQQAIDQILSKRVNVPKKKRPQGTGYQVSVNELPKLKDFTLLMIRPLEITNWASNVNFLAEELAKLGGRTIVIEPDHPDHKKRDFSKYVKRIPQIGESFAESMNYALTNVSTKFVFFLDDPLRALPARHFIQIINQAKETLSRDKIGVLGIGSNMEPNTGVLVTKREDASTKKVAGLFAPCFAFNFEVLKSTGGFRTFGRTAVLSCLDLSLRCEGQGWKSVLIETEKFLCPVSSGKDYLLAVGTQALAYFRRIWKREPISLKSKYPPKEEQIGETANYQEWIRLCDTITEGDILSFKKEADELKVKPLISVVMPVFDPPKKFLIKAIESVLSQAYENWELCIADDASTKKFVRPLLESYAQRDSRIKVTFRKTNGHISVASNSAIKLATGEYVAFLDHDDELRPHSLLEVAKVINANPEAKLIYSDEDIINFEGTRMTPHFKVEWDSRLILGHNYLCHLMVVSLNELLKARCFRKGTEGAQDWDLIFRLTENFHFKQIFHIPQILYHWRAHQKSTAKSLSAKPYVLKNSKKVLTDKLKRQKKNGVVSCIDGRDSLWNVRYETTNKPLISLIIPLKDKVNLLKKCIDSIQKPLSRVQFEIIIINNNSYEDSTLRYLKKLKRHKSYTVLNINTPEFNYSKINNIAARKAKGELLLFLNNDVECIKETSIENMAKIAAESGVGTVGAKLYYPNGKIQHAGVYMGVNSSAGHMFKGFEGTNHGYMSQLSLTRTVSANTAACLMVRKKTFISHGGFDESKFKIAFNDVDFNLRLANSGLTNIWSSDTAFYHYESSTRGYDNENEKKNLRMISESLGLYKKWNLKTYREKYYNSNLSRKSEQFQYAIKKSQLKIDHVTYSNFERGNRSYKSTWSKLAASYNTAVAHVSGHHSETELDVLGECTVEQLKKCFDIKSCDTVLEIGCGVGRVGKVLSKICKKWIGCDISPKMINFANLRLREFENVELVELNGSDLSQFEDSCVDIVYCTVVFMHLDEWDRYNYVREAYRVLKPGGRVYIDNFNLNSNEGWKLFLDHCEIKSSERNPAISVSSTPQELGIFLNRAGFHNVQIEERGLWTWAHGLRNDEKKNNFNSTLDVLSLHIPKTGGTSFGVCLQKIYGNNLMFHYPELDNQGIDSIQISGGKRCVHGHLILDRHEELHKGADLVTWLRNPVERTLSLYNHILSNPDPSNEFHKRVNQEKPSITEFCEMPENQNQLFYWIGDRNPEDFKFIGFLETAEASIVKCASALGWTHVPNFPWVNKKRRAKKLNISHKETDFIKSKNYEELKWIEKASRIFG